MEVNFIKNYKREKKPVELVNDNIRFKEVLVIDEKGEKLGILLRREALEKAYEKNLDLYCVSPQGKPPVCRILDYGRFKFEQQKKAKEAKKKQHVTEVKGLRISPVIDKHDFETKVNHAKKWLQQGNKVKADMRFRGRFITRVEVGKVVMNDFIKALEEYGTVEKRPKLEGNTMSVVIGPKKK